MNDNHTTGSAEQLRLLRKLQRRRVLTASTYLMLKRSTRYLPPIIRGVLGLCLTMLGVLGFLPVLGFWMIPLGLALLATDLPPLARWIKSQVWRSRRRQLVCKTELQSPRTDSKG